MLELIVWYITTFGCGLLFYGIGVFAKKREKPMWFWSGTEVHSYEITDVEKYNKENAIMWKKYSLWFFVSGITYIFNSVAGLVLFVSGFTIGLALLIFEYKKIYKRYSI